MEGKEYAEEVLTFVAFPKYTLSHGRNWWKRAFVNSVLGAFGKMHF